jgi:Tol biopolymer transport system component
MVLHMSFRALKLGTAMSILAVLVAVTIPAHATFPGRNGPIAFVFGPDIYTMNPDGSNVRQLTHLANDNSASWKSWSADGKQIVFCEFPAPDFNGQLWIMDADGKNQHLLLAETGITEVPPSFSPDGRTIVFSRGYDFLPDSGRPLIVQLYSISTDGTRLTQITRHTTLGVHDFGPKFSPDGRTLVLQIDEAGGIFDAIYSLEVDEHEAPEQITPAAISGRRPDISPDGKTIAFQTHCCNPQNETIAVINTRGTGMRELTRNGDNYDAGPHDLNPSWSPEGDRIVFERWAPDFSSSAIFVMKVESGEAKPLITLPALRTPNLNSTQTRPGAFHNHHKGDQPYQIEQGGSLPRWGPMPN